VREIPKQVMRVAPGDRFIVEITDYDLDQSAEQDAAKFDIIVNDGPPVEYVALETEAYSGRFRKEIDTSAAEEEGKVAIAPGDRIYIRYIDSLNTFPGHAVPREATVYGNMPSAGRVRILETRVVPGNRAQGVPPQFIYHTPPRDQPTSHVAFEAPLTVEVIDPDAARDSRSEVVVNLTTPAGSTVDVRCVVSGAFDPSAQGLPFGVADALALEEGRFIGQVIMQLGGKNSPQEVPVTAEMPRNLVGGTVSDSGKGGVNDVSLVTRVLNLTGQDTINATYADEQTLKNSPKKLQAQARLISNGKLRSTDRDYVKDVADLHVGEKLFLIVTDPDQDRTDERDAVSVEIQTAMGDQETIQLYETLAHSGVFTGSVTLKSSTEPQPGNYDEEDPAIEVYFGDTVTMTYRDPAASTEQGTLDSVVEAPVVIGTDGLVAAFSKTFNNEKLAVETKFTIAESYFELFKSHKQLGRQSEQTGDLEAGRRVLREVMEDYPDPKYVPRIAYLLGQFSQELGDWDEAISAYRMIIDQYPEHTLAPDAQYKMAQAHEERGAFDDALEAYVTLAATYPKSPLIASVMIRICDHFYKAEEYRIAAQVGEKFIEKFDGHQHASRIAFRIGQCFYKAESFAEAGKAFDRFTKEFPDDTLTPDSVFWSGESYRKAGSVSEAFRRYNRCRWDFPASEAAKFARGRLALPEMLQQFESEANSVENP
jgi:TolA-binding protein